MGEIGRCGASAATRETARGGAERLVVYGFLLLLPFAGLRRKRLGRLMSVLLLCAGLSAAVALTGRGTGVPTSNYNLTVTATSGLLVHSTGLTLTVK